MIKVGDQVRIPSGRTGEVIDIIRQSGCISVAEVAIPTYGTFEYQLSKLRKISTR